MEALSDDEEVCPARPDLQLRLDLAAGPSHRPETKPLAPSNHNAHTAKPGESWQQRLHCYSSCLGPVDASSCVCLRGLREVVNTHVSKWLCCLQAPLTLSAGLAVHQSSR